MYPILVSGDSILGAKVSGFDFWRFILGAKVSVLISGDLHLERRFHLGFWKSMRSMVMLQRGVSEGNFFWFLELRDFETVSNGFYHVPCLPVR